MGQVRARVLLGAALVTASIMVGLGWWVNPPAVEAENSHKQIILRAKGLASVTWGGTVGSLFSTASYDTTDYPNPRSEQSRSLRGPMVCWSKLDRVISFGNPAADYGNPGAAQVVSVFIQHASNDLESDYVNLMYLSSANRTARGTGFPQSAPGLTSATTVDDSLSLAAVTDGAFGRYLRARVITTAQQLSVPIGIFCDVSGDSLVR